MAGFSLEEVGSPVHMKVSSLEEIGKRGFSLEEGLALQCMEVSLVKLPQSLIGWAIRPRDLFLFLKDRKNRRQLSVGDAGTLSSPAWSHWLRCQGHGTHLRACLDSSFTGSFINSTL